MSPSGSRGSDAPRDGRDERRPYGQQGGSGERRGSGRPSGGAPYRGNSDRPERPARGSAPRDGERAPYRGNADRPARDGERAPYRGNADRPARDGERKPWAKDGERQPYRGTSDRGARPARDGERKPWAKDGERQPYRGGADRADRPARDGERKPWAKDGERQPYRGTSDRGARPARDGERKPWAKDGERQPYRGNSDRPARDGERKPWAKDGERQPYRGNSDRSDRPARDGERKPWAKDGERQPYRSGSDRPARSGERKPWAKDGERPAYQGNSDRPARGGERPAYRGGASRPGHDQPKAWAKDGARSDRPRRDSPSGERKLWTRDGAPARGDRDARFAEEEMTEEQRMQRELRPVRSRHDDPELPADISDKDLDRAARNELKTLTKDNAEWVAKHLAMAARLIESDPEQAHKHVISAARRAGRIAIVRESLAITAYAVGDYALALRELRTYRRISGSNDQLPLMVDSERGVGRPDRALELGRSVDRSTLPAAVQVALAIAMSGARLDLGQTEAALGELEIPQLDPNTAYSWSAELFAAYAEVLQELGRTDEAQQWIERAARANAAFGASDDEDETMEILDMEEDGDDEGNDDGESAPADSASDVAPTATDADAEARQEN